MKEMMKTNPISLSFYQIAGIELIGLFLVAIGVVHLQTEDFPHVSDHIDINKHYYSYYEEWLRVAVTASVVPLAAEYLLDILVSYCYPNFDEASSLEDRLGHGIILLSLIPPSYFPIWLFGDEIYFTMKDVLIGLSHAMIVCGILGKLQNFASDIWDFKECIVVMTLFTLAQFSFVLGHKQELITEYHEIAVIIACGLKTCSLVIFISSCKNIFRLFDEDTNSLHALITTRKYLCTILSVGLIIFLTLCTLFSDYVLYIHQQTIDITANRILIQILAVFLASVLPARMIRRGVTAVEHSIAIERELALKKTYIRYISHEIRSPLSTTSLGIDCLLTVLTNTMPSSSPLAYELCDLAQDCRITCTVAMNTLNDLLLFDKLENNMLSIEKEMFSCYPFIQECMKPFIRQLEVSKIIFEMHYDSQIHHTTLYADRNKIEQVIRNFITNAIKFTPTNQKIVVNVTISTVSMQLLHFAVMDTGAGISVEHQSQLFQQYVQIDSQKLQGGKGSGLGLWISKAIIELHGGVVGVYSAGEGQGSTFYFEIPCEVHTDTIINTANANANAHQERKEQVEHGLLPEASSASFSSATGESASYETLSSYSQKQQPSVNDTTTTATTFQREYNRTVSNSTIIPVYDAHELSSQSASVSSFASPSASAASAASASCSPSSTTLLCTLPASSSSLLLSPDFAYNNYSSNNSNSNNSNNKNKNKHNLLLNQLLLFENPEITPQSRKRKQSSSPLPSLSPSQPFISTTTTNTNNNNTNTSSSSSSSSSSDDKTSSWKILLADDSAVTRKLVSRLLIPLYPIEIVEVSNGLDAVKQIKQSLLTVPFDIVIIDNYMPCMDGTEAIAIMRKELHYEGFICAVTGSRIASDQIQLLTNGANMIMEKPFHYPTFYKQLMMMTTGDK